MRIQRRPLALMAFLAATLNAGLAVAQDEKQDKPAKLGGPTAAAQEAAENGNAFGLDLYRQLAGSESGNLFFSPYSISAAMGMAYAGAEGETAAQIKKVMHFGDDVGQGQGDLDAALTRTKPRCPPVTCTKGAEDLGSTQQDGMSQALKPSGQSNTDQGGGPMLSLDDHLANGGQANVSADGQKDQEKKKPAPVPTHVVRVANRAWPQVDYPIKDSFIDALKPYRVGVEALDFQASPDAAKDRINDWVGEQTKNKDGEPMIPELLKELTSDTKLVLTNAIYFRGEWDTQFDEADTVKADFTRADGSAVEVDMMNLRDTTLLMGRLPSGAQVASIPYKANGADLVVILPAENTAASMAAAEAELGDVPTALRTGFKRSGVNLAFPKFEVEDEFQLADALQAMGITDAFNSGLADLTGIAEDPNGQNLYISKVVHKAKATFNEEGAEAAAATAVVVVTESMIISTPFQVNRPFVFQIRDTKTGAVLFMGRIMDPTE